MNCRSCKVSVQEIADMVNPSRFFYLSLLKRKGVPITGFTYLDFDRDYEINSYSSSDKSETVYEWRLNELH